MNKFQLLRDDLGRGEDLIWSEVPSAWASFRGRSILTFVWGIIWTGLVIFMFTLPSKNGGPPDLFRVLFVGFGIVFTLSSFRDVITATWSIYGVTNQRVIILTRYPWRSVVQSFYKNDIEFLKKERRDDGSGNLIFKTIRARQSRGYYDKDIGFFGIKDINAVESLVARQFRAGEAASE